MRTYTSRARFAVLAAFVVAAAATAQTASPATRSGATTADLGTVTVGALPFAQYAPTFYVGRVAKQFGLTVKVRPFTRAVDAVEALRAGAIDVAFGGVGSFLPSYANRIPMYITGAIGSGGYRLLRRPSVQVSSYADLKGKKIGITSGALDVLLAGVLQKGGLTTKDVTILHLPGTPDMNQALSRGDVDLIIQSEPDATTAIKNGWGVEVSKPYDTMLGPISKVVMMSQRLYNNTALAQAFTNALVFTINYLVAHPSVKEQFARDTIFRGLLSHDDYVAATDNAPNTFDITTQEVQATADLMLAAGQLKAPLNANDAVKLDLLAKAKEKVGVTVPGTTGVTVTITKSRCAVGPAKVPVGNLVFRIVNKSGVGRKFTVGKAGTVAIPSSHQDLLRTSVTATGNVAYSCAVTKGKGTAFKGVLQVVKG